MEDVKEEDDNDDDDDAVVSDDDDDKEEDAQGLVSLLLFFASVFVFEFSYIVFKFFAFPVPNERSRLQ